MDIDGNRIVKADMRETSPFALRFLVECGGMFVI